MPIKFKRLARVNNAVLEAGCYVDSVRGWRGLDKVIDLAESLGWRPEGRRARRRMHWAIRQSFVDGSFEMVVDYADEAERWLNDHTSDGYVWHWSHGDFFLSPWCGDDPDCADDTCLCER